MKKYYTSADGKTLYQVAKDNKGKIIIPDGVESIAKRAFANCEYITEVDLPYSLLEIGEEAFRGCKSLSRIEIPCGVKRIPYKCFMECENLSEVVLPEGLMYIDYMSFFGCHILSLINFPDSLRRIEEHTFSGCRAITTLKLGSKLKHIGQGAFYYSGIKTLQIGVSQEPIQIEALVFYNTPLQTIKVDPHNKLYTDAGCNVILEKKTGRVICGTSKSTIPDTATVIAEGAFSVTPNEIIIPSSVKKIENCAFFCEKNTTIKLKDGVEEIATGAFQPGYGYPEKQMTVYISSSVKVIQEQLSEVNFLIDPANKNYHYDREGQNIISKDGKLVWGRLLKGVPVDGVKELHVTINHELDYTDLIIPENIKYVSDGIFGVDCNFFERIIATKGTQIAFPDDWESDCEIVVVEPSNTLLSDQNYRVKNKIYPSGTSAEELKRALGMTSNRTGRKNE